jgi:hypothetical protein
VAQIVGTNPDVAIADDHDLMGRERKHLLQQADLAVWPTGLRFDHEPVPISGRVFQHLLQHRDCRIPGIGDAEDHLVDRVILAAERSAVLRKPRLEPPDRFEDRHGRCAFGTLCGPLREELECAKETEQPVSG